MDEADLLRLCPGLGQDLRRALGEVSALHEEPGQPFERLLEVAPAEDPMPPLKVSVIDSRWTLRRAGRTRGGPLRSLQRRASEPAGGSVRASDATVAAGRLRRDQAKLWCLQRGLS